VTSQFLRIVEEAATEEALRAHQQVPIAFRVESILRLELVDTGLGGVVMVDEPLAQPYVKDYDQDPNEAPTDWPKQWDVSGWRVFSAMDSSQLVGGAVIALDTPGYYFLEGRKDMAALADIRVKPELRHRGVGSALFRAAATWANAQGCRLLKIETQNVNVPACNFYSRIGSLRIDKPLRLSGTVRSCSSRRGAADLVLPPQALTASPCGPSISLF